MHSLYLYIVVAVLSCGLVAADTCQQLSATFTVSPQICFPSYTTNSSQAVDATGGDKIATFLNGLSTPLSHSCAVAFTNYYCAKFYPQCSNNSTLPDCKNTCSNVVSACASESGAFGGQLPLPTQSQCDALTVTPCTATPTTNLTTWYADCKTFNISNYKSGLNNYVCTPQYTVPATNLSYTNGDDIFSAMKSWAQLAANPDDGNIPVSMYYCAKAFTEFWCASSYPECPTDSVLPVLPVCGSICTKILNVCYENTTQYFNPKLAYKIPTAAFCNGLPNNPGKNCFIPPANSTTVQFFFGADPPDFNPTQPPKPTNPPQNSEEYLDHPTPPGGYARGGGIGAAVLVGILGIIGGLMLLMKKQDSR